MPAFQELWPRWRQAIRPAANRGALCFGPNRGRTLTYSSPRRWVSGYEPAGPEEATSAAAASISAWCTGQHDRSTSRAGSGSSPGWARDAFAQAGDEIERVDVEGGELWQLVGDEVPLTEPVGIVRLLPYFDAYSVGCHPRERLFVGRAAERALARGQAGNYPILLVDGWSRGSGTRSGRGRSSPSRSSHSAALSSSEHGALQEQVEHIGRIQEATATLTVGTVSVGPHA